MVSKLDRYIGLGIACAAVVLMMVWPFDGVHSCAWEETAIAAGLLPQGKMLPGLGVYLAHLPFAVLPYGMALALVGFVAKLLVGVCGFLAYGVFSRVTGLATFPGARDLGRRSLAGCIAAAVAAFAFVCSQPMWMVAQGQFGQLFVIFLVLLSAWFLTQLLGNPSYTAAVATLATLGILCAETPLGWILLALFLFLAVRYIGMGKDETWEEFLDPVRLQRTKWSMTFAFLGVFIVGVLLETGAFVRLDGLHAENITASELPVAYLHAYVDTFTSACSVTGACLLAFAVIIPSVLAFLLARAATDEESFLPLNQSIFYFLCGLVAFLQLSPFSAVWFWNQTEAVSVSSSLLPLSMLLDALVLAWAIFVLCVEVLCRDYAHIESTLYQSVDDVSMRKPLEQPEVNSVRLTPGRLVCLLVPLAIVALIAWGRRLPDDRWLQSLVTAFVNETIDEASGTKYLFTDGAFDAYVRLEARRRGVPLGTVSLMDEKSNRDAYVRQLVAQGYEDRVLLATGAAETLHTWVTTKTERIPDVSVQLAFEFFCLNGQLKPVIYGLLVRPADGDIEAAAASVARCHELADAIVSAHDTGVWRHAKDRFLKDRLLIAQFRLAVIGRLRAIYLDTADRVKESIEEIGYADRLNACNPSLAKLVRRMDWIRRQNGEDLTPREGLEVAMKRLDLNMARRYAQPILHEDPDEPNANFAVGMSFYAEAQYAKAEEYLKRVLKRKPDEAAVYNNLALICLRTDRLQEAGKNVRKALELKPDRPEIKETLQQIVKARKERKTPFAFPAQCNASVITPDRVGVCSWSWQKPMTEVAAEMKKANVKGIHLALGPFIAPDERHGAAEGAEAFAFVKGMVASGEWELMSTMIGTVGEDYSTLETIRKTGGIVPDEHWAANRKIVTDGAKLTKELGCEYMSTHAGFLDENDPVAFAKYVERVTWMRDECAKYGVTLILESGQETAEDLAKFMAKVPGVGINFDPANMILYAKGEPLKALKTLMPWIRQVHVKDACVTKTPGTWGTEVVWGTGEVGGKAFLDELRALGYKGNFVIEREAGNDRAGDIRMAVNALLKQGRQ